MKLEEKIDAMRRKLFGAIYIRGVSKTESFESEAPLIKYFDNLNGMYMGSGTVPAYIVDPLYNLNSLAWVRKLQATVHAATWRALYKCKENSKDHIKWIKDYSEENISDEKLPAIMVFGCPYGREYRFGKRDGDLSFDGEFNSHNGYYESAAVHGEQRGTFRESALLTSERDGKIIVSNPKFYEVDLNSDEMRNICRKLDDTLKRECTFQSLLELDKFYLGYGKCRKRGNKRGSCSWDTVRKVARIDNSYQGGETTPDHPAAYLIQIAAARALTNKFTRKLVEYVNALPELTLDTPSLAAS